MYSVILVINRIDLCEVRLKSITQVCKFLDTVNFDLCKVHVLSPRGKIIDPISLLEVWHA